MRRGFTLIELVAVLALVALLAALAAPAIRAPTLVGRNDSLTRQRTYAVKGHRAYVQLDTAVGQVAQFVAPDGFTLTDSQQQSGPSKAAR